MKYKEFVKFLGDAEKSDVDWIICEATGKKRSELSPNMELSKKEQKIAQKYAKKLRKGIPLAQVLGYTMFCDNKILVNKNVLCPRAETEELVQLVKDDNFGQSDTKILDICTGSGAIAISLTALGSVVATDISKKALRVAKRNAKLAKTNVKFVCSNMFKKIWGHYDIIVCNPPYIAWGDNRVDKSVFAHEPHIALFAKDNGLEFYKILAQNAQYYLYPGAKLYLEVGIDQAIQVAKLFENYSSVEIKKDMQNTDRFVVVTR